jgi:hypothetical protein
MSYRCGQPRCDRPAPPSPPPGSPAPASRTGTRHTSAAHPNRTKPNIACHLIPRRPGPRPLQRGRTCLALSPGPATAAARHRGGPPPRARSAALAEVHRREHPPACQTAANDPGHRRTAVLSHPYPKPPACLSPAGRQRGDRPEATLATARRQPWPPRRPSLDSNQREPAPPPRSVYIATKDFESTVGLGRGCTDGRPLGRPSVHPSSPAPR